MWQQNGFASNGVKEFSEKGEAWTLIKEVEAAGERIQSVYGIFSAPAVLGGTGQMNTEFEVFARHSYVSNVKRTVSLSLSERFKKNLFLISQHTSKYDVFIKLGQITHKNTTFFQDTHPSSVPAPSTLGWQGSAGACPSSQGRGGVRAGGSILRSPACRRATSNSS